MWLVVCIGFVSELYEPEVGIWLISHLVLDLLYLAREVAVVCVFKYNETPKKFDVYLHFLQVFLLWQLSAASAIYGTVAILEFPPIAEWLYSLMWLILAVDYITVGFCVMILPLVIK